MSTSSKIRILLAAPASLMGRSLRSFLGTMPDIEVVGSMDLLEDVIPRLRATQAATLLLDAALLNDSPGTCLEVLMEELNAALPEVRSIVLVDGAAQQKTVLNAKNARALPKGELGDQLREAIRANIARPAAI